MSDDRPGRGPIHGRPGARSEILAKADELRKMAQTARTADAQSALLRVADRFTALAERRIASMTVEGRSAATD
jgi:hypothetical protein